MNKTKPIAKGDKKEKHSKPKKPIMTEEGDPIIKNLSDFVTSVKVDYSSKPLYTGGRILASHKHIYSTCNAQICVFDPLTGQVVDTIKHIGEEIVNFSVCPEQKYIATFTQNSMLRMLQLPSKKLLHTVKLPNSFANDIKFSPTGKHMGIALGNTIHIFTVQTMKRTHSYNPTNSKFVITKLQWHPNPDKLQIVTCDMQRNIAIFDYILNKVIAVSQSGNGGTQFAIDRQGNFILVVDGLLLKLYDFMANLKTQVQVQEYFQCLFFLSDTQVLLGGSQTQLYSTTIPTVSKLTLHKNMTDTGISKILQSGSPQTPQILILSTQQNISIVQKQKNQLKFNKMIIGYNDEIIDIKNSKLLGTQLTEEQNKYYIVVTNSNNFKIINKSDHSLVYLVKGHTNTVLAVDFCFPFIVSAGKDRLLKLWRIDDRNRRVQLLANYKGHAGDILSLVCLPKSKIICTVSQDLTIKLWPICPESQQKIQIKSSIRTAIAHQKSINAVRASANEQLIATCSQDRTLKIWNHYLTNVLTLAGHKRGVWDAAFHPVEKLIVSAGGDGMIKGWSLDSGDCLWSMGEGPALIRCAWIYYNQIVTGSLSGVLKIWDIRKQTSISYDKHQGKIWALDITKPPKSATSIIYTGATDSTYNIWVDNTSQKKTQIMQENQEQQKQRLFYEQYLAQQKYCDAAVIAFKANYTKLFFNAVAQIDCRFDADAKVEVDGDGVIKMVDEGVNQGEGEGEKGEQGDFGKMVANLLEIDRQRLFHNIQAMISTIKLYKIGNRILLQVFKQTKMNDLMNMNSIFRLAQKEGQPVDINEFTEKKSPLERWLQSLIGNQCKHLSRLDKYIKGTHWIEHLYKIENPFTA